MLIEFTCLSCTRTFAVQADELARLDYLACIGCQKPVPVDLLDAVKRVCLCFNTGEQKNSSQWLIRCRPEE